MYAALERTKIQTEDGSDIHVSVDSRCSCIFHRSIRPIWQTNCLINRDFMGCGMLKYALKHLLVFFVRHSWLECTSEKLPLPQRNFAFQILSAKAFCYFLIVHITFWFNWRVESLAISMNASVECSSLIIGIYGITYQKLCICQIKRN